MVSVIGWVLGYELAIFSITITCLLNSVLLSEIRINLSFMGYFSIL